MTKSQLLELVTASPNNPYDLKNIKQYTKKELVAFLIKEDLLSLEEKVSRNELLERAKSYPDFKISCHGKNKKTLRDFLNSKGTISPIHMENLVDHQPIVDLEKKLFQALNLENFQHT